MISVKTATHAQFYLTDLSEQSDRADRSKKTGKCSVLGFAYTQIYLNGKTAQIYLTDKTEHV